MKKNLIALAIFGAFSGAALAQSNVTVYGIIDMNYQYSDPDASGASSTSGINSGHQSGSRWGIRGSEVLSPGLNAVFTLEGGFSGDTGALGQASAACNGASVTVPCGGASVSRLFGRQVWAGLSGGFGTVVAGRVATFSSGTGSFDMFGNTDPFLTGFTGSNFLGSSAQALRLDNSVLYSSPSFGGFKLGVGHSFNASGGEIAGSGNNVDVTFTGANFARGPFFAALTYDRIDIPGASDNQEHWQAGLTFDLKFVKLHAGYAKEYDQRVFSAVGTTSGADSDVWMLGVTVPLGGGNLLASYQERDGKSVQLTPPPLPTFDERDVDVWGIAYTYPLSRRTNLYAHFADASGKHNLNNSLTFDRRLYTVGIRHLF